MNGNEQRLRQEAEEMKIADTPWTGGKVNITLRQKEAKQLSLPCPERKQLVG